MAESARKVQIFASVEPTIKGQIELLAQEERRKTPDMVRILLEDALRSRAQPSV